MASSSSSSIQELLFDNKESIPDGLYIKLMNQLLINNKNEKYYKIKYIVIKPQITGNYHNLIIDINHQGRDTRPVIYERIVKEGMGLTKEMLFNCENKIFPFYDSSQHFKATHTEIPYQTTVYKRISEDDNQNDLKIPDNVSYCSAFENDNTMDEEELYYGLSITCEMNDRRLILSIEEI